jgi:protein-S-isoprenylcysteine O-methyltransferase Ste14
MSPPPSPRWTLVKLAAASLVLGLLLVSLDITPSSLLAMAEDAGPALQQWAKFLWRAAEILLGCLLAGGALVLPYWLVQRRKRKPQLTAVPAKAPQASVAPATLTPPAAPTSTAPAAKTT